MTMKYTSKEHTHKKKTAGGRTKRRAPNGFFCARALTESVLKKLGIDDSYEIVVADRADLVENTAAQELEKFLAKAGLNVRSVSESKSTSPKRFLLGRDSNLKFIARLAGSGELKIRDVSAQDDGFHLKRIGDTFVVAGANPRGVLYGVYAFEDYVNEGAVGALDTRKIPYYRKRGSGAAYYHNYYINLWTDDFSDEKAAYLSRLGVNQLPSENDVATTLNVLVQSDIFPFQTPPQPDMQRKIRSMSAICKNYGIDFYLMLWEPLLPRLAGDLEKYPAEALGTVNRPWGTPKIDRTLCIHSPIVQKHYRHMMRKFVREYPDVRGVFLYNMDGSSWICTPELCDRCRTLCKDSPPAEYNPWESQALLVTLLAKAAHEENPDFDFRFWGSVHYPGERCEKLLRSAQGYNSLLSNWTGSDHDVMIADAAKPASAFVASQKVCEERGIPFYAHSSFSNLEAVPHSLPFPFHVCDTLTKFKGWGAQCIEEHTGPIPAHNPINALVMKEFQWNPGQNAQTFLAGLAVRQFGKKAGRWMVRAWEEMEKAFDTWNDMPFNPLCGSQPYVSVAAEHVPESILPDLVAKYNSNIDVRIDVEPFRAAGYQKFRERAFVDKMKLMCVHLSRAAEHANRAIAAASDKEFIGVCYYEGLSGRPTQKEYAELNHAPIALAAALCRQQCDMLLAYHLLTEIENARAGGDARSVKMRKKAYYELIREDIGVQEQFCTLLAGFAEMRPCYMRTSLLEREISDLLLATRAKIDKLKEFLRMTLSS